LKLLIYEENIHVIISWIEKPVIKIEKVENMLNKSFTIKNKLKMKVPDFTISILVDGSTRDAFNAINNVRGWWSERISGITDQLNQEFTYQRKDVHKCTLKVVELKPDSKVVWLVLDNYFNFTEDKTEWAGTKIQFEVFDTGKKTQIKFTHFGLNPGFECYDICFDAWTFYIQKSLQDLITNGKGQPNPEFE
jgi:hypothetical protein